MSQESKQAAKEIQESFKKLHQASEDLHKKSTTVGDKTLTEKIQRVKEGAGEVVKHLEKRIGPG